MSLVLRRASIDSAGFQPAGLKEHVIGELDI
jgi:hypothetical protein